MRWFSFGSIIVACFLSASSLGASHYRNLYGVIDSSLLPRSSLAKGGRGTNSWFSEDHGRSYSTSGYRSSTESRESAREQTGSKSYKDSTSDRQNANVSASSTQGDAFFEGATYEEFREQDEINLNFLNNNN